MGVTKEVKELRTKQINDFMSQFENLKETDTEMISEGLHTILGELPGIDFEYGVDMVVNESSNGWILRLGGHNGFTGHHDYLCNCLISCLSHGYEFYIV